MCLSGPLSVDCTGLHVVLSPGIYHMTQSLTLSHNGQTILGIGLASLIAPPDGTPCIVVAKAVKGVRVAGLMLQAGLSDTSKKAVEVSSILEWGERGDAGDSSDPGILSDIFVRVGGPVCSDHVLEW